MKVWEFLFNGNTWESSASTISIHRTKRGAEMAMQFHKEAARLEYEEDQKEYPSEFGFGYGEWWGIRETDLLDY